MTNIVINDCHNYIILVILKWKCLDPKVAVWLLNPDSPTASFEQIVKTYTDKKQVHVSTLKFGSLLLFFSVCIINRISILMPLLPIPLSGGVGTHC